MTKEEVVVWISNARKPNAERVDRNSPRHKSERKTVKTME